MSQKCSRMEPGALLVYTCQTTILQCLIIKYKCSFDGYLSGEMRHWEPCLLGATTFHLEMLIPHSWICSFAEINALHTQRVTIFLRIASQYLVPWLSLHRFNIWKSSMAFWADSWAGLWFQLKFCVLVNKAVLTFSYRGWVGWLSY